ncbi:MAG TPA: hypothetical protein VFJ96_05715 [Gemmatimonadaceae bacterium]|jgi:hypothetical protein|nr:hypothetical protein [Gemmatimonadaceae bacterium]
MAGREHKRTRKGKTHRIDPEHDAQNMNRQGPSPGDPIDEDVIHSPKSDWVENDSPAAGDEVTPDELEAFDLLGRSGVRDDAIEGTGGDGGLPASPSGRTPGARRRNPPLPEVSDEIDMSGRGDGGGGASGGASGGARGNAGSDSHGAGSAGRGTDQAARRGPAEFDASSRFDYDAPDDTVGDDEDAAS